MLNKPFAAARYDKLKGKRRKVRRFPKNPRCTKDL
jgi:hypothetical protein